MGCDQQHPPGAINLVEGDVDSSADSLLPDRDCPESTFWTFQRVDRLGSGVLSGHAGGLFVSSRRAVGRLTPPADAGRGPTTDAQLPVVQCSFMRAMACSRVSAPTSVSVSPAVWMS
jgi:hypothetical protein